jgi:AmiR/NasT family two-component response regulator
VARSVLIVVGDSSQRATLVRMLTETDDWNATSAGTPEEAMHLATTTTPAVALLTVPPDSDRAALNLTDRLTTEFGIPVVLHASKDSHSHAMAVHEGVMGILVDPITPAALRGTLEVAVHRCREMHALRRETESLRRTIEDRKTIERAKGLLMELTALSEREAYARIRQKSMDSQRPMVEIARAIILAYEMNGGIAAPLVKR